MYKKILIATDGSELAEKAVSHGLGLASTISGSVTIVTVTEIWSAFEMAHKARSGGDNPIEAYEKTMAEAAREILASVEESAKQIDVSCETVHVRDQHPAEGIIDIADKKGCELIVMASHGRRGVQKVLLGSVASEVLTHSKIPVLIVK